jgi:hypothetical protein
MPCMISVQGVSATDAFHMPGIDLLPSGIYWLKEKRESYES